MTVLKLYFQFVTAILSWEMGTSVIFGHLNKRTFASFSWRTLLRRSYELCRTGPFLFLQTSPWHAVKDSMDTIQAGKRHITKVQSPPFAFQAREGNHCGPAPFRL
jgi:hypothetical protein